MKEMLIISHWIWLNTSWQLLVHKEHILRNLLHNTLVYHLHKEFGFAPVGIGFVNNPLGMVDLFVIGFTQNAFENAFVNRIWDFTPFDEYLLQFLYESARSTVLLALFRNIRVNYSENTCVCALISLNTLISAAIHLDRLYRLK